MQCAACGVRCVVCVGSVQCAVCRLPFAVCSVPFADRSWLLADFVDDASAVKLRTAQFGSCHTGRCIAYLLEFIYLSLPRSQSILVKLLAVSTCLPSLLLEFTLYMLLVCTHDFEFLDDETRVELRLDKFCR